MIKKIPKNSDLTFSICFSLQMFLKAKYLEHLIVKLAVQVFWKQFFSSLQCLHTSFPFLPKHGKICGKRGEGTVRRQTLVSDCVLRSSERRGAQILPILSKYKGITDDFSWKSRTQFCCRTYWDKTRKIIWTYL